MSTATPDMSRDEARSRLAFNLKRLFDQFGTSSRRLAKEHGLCYRVLQRAAAGQSDPSWSLMWNLAKALGVSLTEFGQPPEQHPKKSRKAR